MAQPASLLVLGSHLDLDAIPCPRGVPIQRVARVADAVKALSERPYLALIIALDVSLAGLLEALTQTRAKAPIMPILLISAELSRGLLNAAQQQRCQVLARPTELAHVESFVERARTMQRLTREQLRAGMAKLINDHALDPRSAEFLAATVGIGEAGRAALERLPPEEAHRRLRALLLRLNLRTVSGLDAQVLRSAALARAGRDPAREVERENAAVVRSA